MTMNGKAFHRCARIITLRYLDLMSDPVTARRNLCSLVAALLIYRSIPSSRSFCCRLWRCSPICAAVRLTLPLFACKRAEM
jgi:hypothetical protein